MTNQYICGNNSFSQIDGLLECKKRKEINEENDYPLFHATPQRLPVDTKLTNLVCTWSQIWALTGRFHVQSVGEHMAFAVMQACILFKWDVLHVKLNEKAKQTKPENFHAMHLEL